MVVRRMRAVAVATFVVALCNVACDPACDDAREKLDECKDEIERARAAGGATLPIAVSEECTDTDQCVADCVNAADCPEIAQGLGPTTDPNTPPVPGSGEFSRCINRCLPSR